MLSVDPIGGGVAVGGVIQDAAVVAISHIHPTAVVLCQANGEKQAVGVMTGCVGGKVRLSIDPGGCRPGFLGGYGGHEDQKDRANDQNAGEHSSSSTRVGGQRERDRRYKMLTRDAKFRRRGWTGWSLEIMRLDRVKVKRRGGVRSSPGSTAPQKQGRNVRSETVVFKTASCWSPRPMRVHPADHSGTALQGRGGYVRAAEYAGLPHTR